jgi:hypothetical protein
MTSPQFADLSAVSYKDIPDAGKTNSPASVYNSNYDISVNVKSEANPEEIAKTVVMQIRRAEDRRIKGNRI